MSGKILSNQSLSRPSRTASAHHPRTKSPPLKRAVAGVTLGNLVEWFDFALYSSLATVMGKVFFPDSDATTQLLAAYATFAAGFLIRPLGSLVFGPIGDRYGRRTALSLSIALMAVATFAIALIPSYAAIGIAAPILLILMRLLQGLSTGGEYGGSCTFIAEHSPDARRGFFTSWLEFGNISGFLLGALVVNAFTFVLGEETMQAGAWRIPFVIGGLLGLIALYLRRRLDETPVFEAMRESGERLAKHDKLGFVRMLASEWPQLLKCAGLVAVFNMTYYVVLGYIPGYLVNVLGRDAASSNAMAMVATLFMLALIPLSGWLSDRVGRKTLIMTGCLLIIALAFPAFHLLASSTLAVVLVALIALVVAQLCFEGAMPATLTSLFRAPVRYSGLAISYNISVSLFGGTAPLINTWLIEISGNPMIPAWYLITGAVIGLVALYFTQDSTGKPLPN
ncbi:MFS transporter [Halotalea alkalilenta]|uniref:MFS transporter n=1 Tax=Halotalea alkalilenta TaxID=376489 RepID=UPI00069323F7|nr:MFS transporter [Halotalea alkalilenta]